MMLTPTSTPARSQKKNPHPSAPLFPFSSTSPAAALGRPGPIEPPDLLRITPPRLPPHPVSATGRPSGRPEKRLLPRDDVGPGTPRTPATEPPARLRAVPRAPQRPRGRRRRPPRRGPSDRVGARVYSGQNTLSYGDCGRDCAPPRGPGTRNFRVSSPRTCACRRSGWPRRKGQPERKVGQHKHQAHHTSREALLCRAQNPLATTASHQTQTQPPPPPTPTRRPA